MSPFFNAPSQSLLRKPVGFQPTAQDVARNCARLGLPVPSFFAATGPSLLETQKNALGNLGASASVSPSLRGIGIYQKDATSAATTWGYPCAVTSDGAYTGDFSLLFAGVLITPNGSSGVKSAFGQRANSGFNSKAMIRSHTSSDGTTFSANAIAFLTQGPSSSTACGASNQIDDLFHVYIASRAGTSLYLYRDGVLIASNSGTLQPIGESGVVTAALGHGSSTGSQQHMQGTSNLVSAWNLGLNSQQAMVLSVDWPALLAPPTRKVFFSLTNRVLQSFRWRNDDGGE